ncbi:MAG TPA: DegQ family serine endoprotease [Burkholderiales bacterium]|nr:DegQ family serine endoprotease [Burkholderiales bacterium]
MFTNKTVSRLAIAAILPALIAAYYTVAVPGTPPAHAGAQDGVTQNTAAATQQMLPDFTRIVEQNGPAVVNVSVSRKVPTVAQGPLQGIPEDDPMYEFFRRFGPPQQQPGEQPLQRGQGSGFIVSADGVILTNAHVASDATDIVVKLTDKREFDAKVIGVDKRSDIAVLKIEAKNLPVVKIGNPARLKVGEWVAAIGSPFGLENTITSGIVSAKARALPDENYVPFIQTDVAVNPGNSGGPLFNMNGEVVGINSQIFSRTGGYMGLSFAIPIDVAMNIKDQLVQNGKVTRGRIGVQIQEVNQALAKSFGLSKTHGALVSVVEPGSPADKAGLKSGDVVLGVNGKEIDQLSDLTTAIANIKPGTSARLQVWRNGDRQDINVTVGELTEQKVATVGASEPGSAASLGLTLRELAPDERAKLKTDGGLVVQNTSGAGARAGIQAGDVILALNETPVTSIEQLKQLVKKSAKTVALLVQRNEARIYVPVPLS